MCVAVANGDTEYDEPYCHNNYKKFKEKPRDIPNSPESSYKNKWKGWNDWLGTGRIAPGNLRPFEKARAFVHKLKLKDQKEWKLYCQNKIKGFKERPKDIPVAPALSYKNQWKGIGDWFWS